MKKQSFSNLKSIKHNSVTNLSPEEKLMFNLRTKILMCYNELKNDDIFYHKNFTDDETLFHICLPSIKKTPEDRDDDDIILISFYLYRIKKFVKLMKSNNNNGDNKNMVELLKFVAKNIEYIKFPEQRLLMRNGDEGNLFYILLNGMVSIYLPRKKNVDITLNEFFRYIALLIAFKEQQIIKQVLKDNESVVRDNISYIDNLFKNNDNILRTIVSIYNNNRNKKINKKMIRRSNTMTDKTKKFQLKKNAEVSKEKLFLSAEQEKYLKELRKFLDYYLTIPEKSYFYSWARNFNDETEIDDGIKLTPDEYVNRINNYSISQNKLNVKSRSEKDNKYLLIIYEYQKIVDLSSGEMFGDIALSTPMSKRTATILTLKECHFICMNRDTYNQSIKSANEKNRRDLVYYVSHISILIDFPVQTLEKRIFNNFIFKSCKKNEYIVKQNEINKNIIFLKEGTFEIILNGNINDIVDLIDKYTKNLYLFEDKKIEVNHELLNLITKMNDQKSKIERLFPQEIMKKEEIKVILVNSPSIFGLRETEEKVVSEENTFYKSFYDIICTRMIGDYILLDKKIFYGRIYGTHFSVKEETKNIAKIFIEKTINRLINIRYGKIWNLIMSYNLEKDFNSTLQGVNKEGYGNSNMNEKIDIFLDNYNGDIVSNNHLVKDMINKNDMTSAKKLLRITKRLKVTNDKYDNKNIKKYFSPKNTSLPIIIRENQKKKVKFDSPNSKNILNKNKKSNSNDSKERKSILSIKGIKQNILKLLKNNRCNSAFPNNRNNNNNIINKEDFSTLGFYLKNVNNIISNKNSNMNLIDSWTTTSKKFEASFKELFKKKYEIENNEKSSNEKVKILNSKKIRCFSGRETNAMKFRDKKKVNCNESFLINRRTYYLNVTRNFFLRHTNFKKSIRLRSSSCSSLG